MNLHGQWSLQVLVLVIGALIFPAWMGCGWLALKLWKAHKVFGFWTFRAKLEPRDLWVGLYWDASRSLIALYVCIILETQDAVDIAWREWRKARERRMMGDLAGAAEAERFALFWLQLPLWPGEPLIRELLEYEE